MSRLIELRVSGFQKISAVRIRPDGRVVVIAGDTDQGKTSVLKAIWALLEGKASAPKMLIREGEEECNIFGDFGAFTVSRTFTRTSNGEDITMSLKVVNADGSPVRKQPQAMLNSLIGAYAFDPLAFAKAPAKDQFELLKKFVTGIDFDKMAELRADYFAKRTDANRRAKEFATLAERIKLPEGGCPKPIDVTAKLAELAAANAHNAAILPEKQKRFHFEADLRGQRQRAIDQRAKAAALRKEAEDLEALAGGIDVDVERQEKIIAALPPIPEPQDTAVIQAVIAAADQITATRTLFENRRRNEDEAEKWEGEASNLTNLIDELDRKKREAVEAAKMPVAGIGFGENEILLNGIPFSQAGTAAKIRTSVAIGMSMKPELRIMTIDEGSELASGDIAMIEKMAEEFDYQVWLVRVDEHAKQGFIMEDGHLAHAEAAE